MKLTVLFLTVAISATLAYHRKVLDYSLRTINHLASDHIGPFQCIFYDISSEGFFNDILNDLANSPKLQRIVRLVVRGTFRREHMNLPYNPVLILINPGPDEAMFGTENRVNLAKLLTIFNPAAKVLVFVDFDTYGEYLTQTFVVWTMFNNAVFVDKRSARLRCSSLKNYAEIRGWPHPGVLFKWHKQQLRGGVITYNKGPEWNYAGPLKWFEATVDMLGATPARYSGPNRTKADITLYPYIVENPTVQKRFESFFITDITVGRILVPKGRPVNAVELMLMPFNWQVWVLLLITLVLAETGKRFKPNLFKNDPVLLVVCGFERHNLHQAGRWEKIILHSLIILMFFVTNAFESKVVSLMVDKPSVQPIKSLSDFDKHGIKIYANLTITPEAVDDAIVGKYIVHGVRQMWDPVPGTAIYVTQEVADFAPKMAFNIERGEPWFDVLKEIFPPQIPMYEMAYRTPLLEVFRFTHLAFVEAGLMDLHTRRCLHYEYYMVWGRRPRKYKENEIYLKFGDMMLAWLVLPIGLGASLVGFLGELTCSRVAKRFEKKNNI